MTSTLTRVRFHLVADGGGHDVSTEARDEQGRWTGGGEDGDNQGPTAAAASGEAFAKDLQDQGMTGDFRGLESVNVSGMNAAFDRVYQDFPIVHGKLEGIQTMNVVTGHDAPLDVALAVRGAYAVTYKASGENRSSIWLNPDPQIWAGTAPDHLSIGATHALGFTVADDSAGLLTHEMGHVVADSWPGSGAEFQNMVNQARNDVWGGDKPTTGREMEAKIGQDLSAYAIQGGLAAAPHEFWGEAFAANNIPGHLDSLPADSAERIVGFAAEINKLAADKLAEKGLPPQRVI